MQCNAREGKGMEGRGSRGQGMELNLNVNGNPNLNVNSQLTLEPKLQNSDTSQHWQFLRKFPPPAFTNSFSFIMEEVLQEI